MDTLTKWALGQGDTLTDWALGQGDVPGNVGYCHIGLLSKE